VCGRCGGRLLDAAAQERVLVELCGVERTLLAELCAHYVGRFPCPACARNMSQVPVRGVIVDLCGGCGALFLDGGELTRLTDGRITEILPAALLGADADLGMDLKDAAEFFGDAPDGAPGVVTGVVTGAGAAAGVAGAPQTRSDGRAWAVFAHQPLDAGNGAQLQNAYLEAQFRTRIDAAGMAARAQGGVVADDCSEAEAVAVAAAFRRCGIPATAVSPQGLPPPYRIKEATVDGDMFVFPDALGRVRRLPLSSLRCVSAIRTKVTSAFRGAEAMLGAGEALLRMRSSSRGIGEQPTVEKQAPREVTNEVVIVDVICATDDGVERLRLDSEGIIARSTTTQAMLASLAQGINSRAPAQTFRQRGFLALLTGDRVPLLPSMRAIDRELSWCLWRRDAPLS